MEFADVEPGDGRLLADVLPVLAELRPHLTAETFPALYAEGHGQGLRFLAAYDGEHCVGVAGWRLVTTTHVGRKLYVDDLVTTEASRSHGVGNLLLTEVARRARAAGCTVVDLDSGVHRARAHGFYFRAGMHISSFHFTRVLDDNC